MQPPASSTAVKQQIAKATQYAAQIDKMAFQNQNDDQVPVLDITSRAAPPLITLEVAQNRLSGPPTLKPRSNSVNIQILILLLDQILTVISSYQSREHGYSGLILQPEVYAL